MPMKAAVFNNKGGVGKTTISIILTQIALKRGSKVVAVDQDEQANFSTSLRYLKNEPNYKDLFTLKTSLVKEDFEGSYDIMIIDCAPGFNDRTRFAIRNADIVIIPIRPDEYSLLHFTKIMQEAGNRNLNEIPIVKVGFTEGNIHDKTRAARDISRIIQDKGYKVIGDLPIHKSINDNLSTGRAKWWSLGLTAAARKPFELLYTRLNFLYMKILGAIPPSDPWPTDGDYYDDPENVGIKSHKKG